MLLGQNSRRYQDRDLFAVAGSFESRAQCDLGLPVSHVAADQAVHRPRAFHILFDLADRGFLVLGLLKRKRAFQILHPDAVSGESIAGRDLPFGIKAQQVIGDLQHLFPDEALGRCPVPGPQPGDLRGFPVWPDIVGKTVRLVDRHKKLVPFRVKNTQKVP